MGVSDSAPWVKTSMASRPCHTDARNDNLNKGSKVLKVLWKNNVKLNSISVAKKEQGAVAPTFYPD